VRVGADDLAAWVKAFAFTEIVEAPLYRRLVPTRWGPALAASAITHPFVWFLFPWLGEELGASWAATSLVSEVFAVAVEAVFFRRIATIGWRRALLASVFANASSVGLGLLARATLGIV